MSISGFLKQQIPLSFLVAACTTTVLSGCDTTDGGTNSKTQFPVGGTPPSAGTVITAESIVDVAEIKRVTSALTHAVDSQEWALVSDILEDQVDTTIGETGPGVSRVKPETEILERWKGMYADAQKLVIHHITSNERVLFKDRDNAEVFAKGVIVVENTPAGDFAADGGTLRGYRWVNYHYGLKRTAAGWKVNKILVDYRAQEFNSLPGPTAVAQ